LVCRLQLLPHPYPEDAGSVLEPWGRFTFTIEDGARMMPLVDWQWNLDDLAEWFAESGAALREEEFRIVGHAPLPGESLAQAVWRLRQREFEYDDPAEPQWFDALHAYWEHHNLYVPFRGARNVPSIYIGLNGGVGEASHYDLERGVAWAYRFDMAEFCDDLRQELHQLLLAWQLDTTVEPARSRAATLLQNLAGTQS
jgi:hypothetical protein